MGIILFFLSSIIAIIGFYQVFFNLRYKKDNSKVKFELIYWIVGIVALCVPVLNIFLGITIPLIIHFVYNETCRTSEEVYFKSFLTKKY